MLKWTQKQNLTQNFKFSAEKWGWGGKRRDFSFGPNTFIRILINNIVYDH